ncbi:hypothetical protein QFC24_005303 [Naganishia onofrii]|uniref:Uncharacterized protein n=1 Tax=Naganishia onofrii TaxID=1851511 RepID=A0ACC2XAB6_9TREE|nr:hypothetical protein QFC24_005303 [Naganishia onofrii]
MNEIDLLSDEDFKAEEKKLLRKIDFRLMPALFLLICLNYLDRSALASARVQGIEKDLGMKHGQFNIAISVLFAGYIAGQLPSNMILSRTRPSIYLPVCVAVCLIASGIQKGLKDVHGLEAWRWWLTPRERALAVRRLARDAGGIEDENGNVWKGARDALCDYKGKQPVMIPFVLRSTGLFFIVYLLGLIIISKTSAAAVTSFIPTVIATMKYSKTTTLALQAPPYIFATLLSLACSWSSDRYRERSYHIMSPILLGMVGFIMMACTTATGPRYAGLFLALGGVYGSYDPALAWISSTIPRPRAKRAVALAIINMIGNMAQIYSPYMYDTNFAPRYIPPMACNAAFCLITVFAVLLLRFCLKRENEKLEAKEELEARGPTLDPMEVEEPRISLSGMEKGEGEAIPSREQAPASGFRYAL